MNWPTYLAFDLPARFARRFAQQLVRHCLIPLAVLCQTSTANATLDLAPVDPDDWSHKHAAHLASRAGFGGTQTHIQWLTGLTPSQAVNHYLQRGEWVRAAGQTRVPDKPFEHSGIFESGLDPFPPSRPAATRLAAEQGHALGVQVKPGGNRPLQPVVDKFFYWLRASRLETDRIAYWWANRMLSDAHPLREKMALFWHGHFATNEDKVRDYRKMLRQLQLFQRDGLGPFRKLLIGVAQDPAMLMFLDAGVNTKDSPNENFAREILELFTMGVGHYTEKDVQEAARAFTGWNYQGLAFQIVPKDQDTEPKTFLGQQGAFNGVDIIDIILKQPATAQFVAGKLYRYFVNESLSSADAEQLGRLLFELEFDTSRFLGVLFESKHFYEPRNVGSRIKSPIELIVSTYRSLGVLEVPGVPDLNRVSQALGQRLMHPPTVAGWSHGRSWITPSLLFERSNFVLDVLSPNVGFVPPDRYPSFPSDEIVRVQSRLRQGLTVSEATRPTGVGGEMSASNLLADRDEAFNTRLGTLRGWQMAIEKVIPIPRTIARLNLTEKVLASGAANPGQAVAFLAQTFFSVMPSQDEIDRLAAALQRVIGTSDLAASASFLEEPLRQILHELLALPEYQLG
ncbi:MAG: DUF1800 family protein [Burkholderiaceae bacterium]